MLDQVEKISFAWAQSAGTEEERIIRRMSVDPLFFANNALGMDEDDPSLDALKPTKQQKELLRTIGALSFCKKLFRDRLSEGKHLDLPRYIRVFANKLGISIISGKGTGKTGCSSWLILWFISTQENAKICCIGPTEDTLKQILWSEIHLWYNKRKPDGSYYFKSPLRDKLVVGADTVSYMEGDKPSKNWVAFCRVSPRNADVGKLMGTLSGLHSDNLLILVDEAAAISNEVFVPLENTLAGRNNICLICFNPNRNNGYAYNTHFHPSEKEHWSRLQWNSEESELVSKEYLKILEQKYGGKDTNNYRVAVLGEPPTGNDNSLIPFVWVHNAIDREVGQHGEPVTVIGVDVARTGGDSTIAIARKGKQVKEILKINESDSFSVVDELIKFSNRIGGSQFICVDHIGVGCAVTDVLRKSIYTGRVVPVVVSNSSSSQQFRNLRAELWWRARMLFEHGDISLPNHEALIEQLSSISYSTDKGGGLGKVTVEGKDSIRKRMGGSPDYADALILTMAIQDISKSGTIDLKMRKQVDIWAEETPSQSKGWMRQ